MSDVAERVKKIVVEHLGVDADKVSTAPISWRTLAPILLTGRDNRRQGPP